MERTGATVVTSWVHEPWQADVLAGAVTKLAARLHHLSGGRFWDQVTGDLDETELCVVGDLCGALTNGVTVSLADGPVTVPPVWQL